MVHPKPWWHRLRPRLTRGNAFGFCFLFILCFAMLRFDFPHFHARHRRTTETSTAISTLIACGAFFREDKGKSESAIVRPQSSVRPFEWGHFMLLGAGELMAGVLLYAVFTFTPMAVQVSFGFVSGVIAQIDIFDPKRTKSLGSLWCAITGAPLLLCLIVWRMTDQASWLTAMLVCGTLMAGLTILDRLEDFR